MHNFKVLLHEYALLLAYNSRRPRVSRYSAGNIEVILEKSILLVSALYEISELMIHSPSANEPSVFVVVT
jgi:hypothetical protein